jgi:hypothetical protein
MDVLSIALGAGCPCILLDEMTCCNGHPWKDDESDGNDSTNHRRQAEPSRATWVCNARRSNSRNRCQKGGFPPNHAVDDHIHIIVVVTS